MDEKEFFETKEQLGKLLHKYKKACAAQGLDYSKELNSLIIMVDNEE